MGKLNKKSGLSSMDTESDNLGIDWQQLLVDFQSKTVDETVKNAMDKFMTKENVEFDQVCLILKHYILLESENQLSYLDHFLSFNQQIYINQLIERFNSFAHQPNAQWMISEIIKLISSVCTSEQAGLLLSCSQFSTFVLTSIFDLNILARLKSQQQGFTITEAAILTNIFETILNLCEIKSEIKKYVTSSHIEWLAEALLNINKNFRDLTITIAHLFHLISENASITTNDVLIDLYLNKNFFLNSIEYLSKSPSDDSIIEDISFNLNAKLYLIGSLANIIANRKNEPDSSFKKSDYLLKLLKDYGSLIHYSLDANLSENKNKQAVKTENQIELIDEEENEDTKNLIKSLEYCLEAKLISIDFVSSIFNYFIKDEESNEEDEYESWDEGDEVEEVDGNNNIEMDVEMDKEKLAITNLQDSPKDLNDLKQITVDLNLMGLLVKTISQDDENIFQESDRIEHIYNSVKLIRNEALKTYLLIIESFYLNKSNSDLNANNNQIDIENLFVLLNLLIQKSPEDLEFLLASGSVETKRNESIIKFIEIIYDLFIYFNDSKRNLLSLEHKMVLLNLIKDILLKFKVEIVDLCVRLGKIVSLIAIKERDTNLIEGKEVVQLSATILVELALGSFELGDQNKIDSLRLNAELLDLIIDLFGEDNLAELEKSLNFIEKIKWFSDKFYTKYKKLGNKQKIAKDHSIILKTVKDNFKSFVEYKIKNSK